jgi:hypothetical protein
MFGEEADVPPDVCVEAYMPCPDGGIPELVERFRALLDQLGCDNAFMQAWPAEMGWDDEDCWYGPTAGPPRRVSKLTIAGKELESTAIVSGWSSCDIPGLRGHWLSWELCFGTEGDEQYLVTASAFSPVVSTYISGVGHALWQVMRAFHAELPDVPVFCVFEGWEGDAWEAWETGRGDLWSFDAALVPNQLASRFIPLPEDYVAETLPEGTALARREVWPALPWQEPLVWLHTGMPRALRCHPRHS